MDKMCIRDRGKAVLDSTLKEDAATMLNLDNKAKIMNARNPQRGYQSGTARFWSPAMRNPISISPDSRERALSREERAAFPL